MQYSPRGQYGESVCGDSLVLSFHPAGSCSHPMLLPLPAGLHKTPCSPAHLLWFCLSLLLYVCRCFTARVLSLCRCHSAACAIWGKQTRCGHFWSRK